MSPMSQRSFVSAVAGALALWAVVHLHAQQVGVKPPTVADVTDVTFATSVAPLVFERCVICHHDGGSAPFSLASYAAVRQHAQQIAAVTKSRFMPPWKAEPGYGGDFVGQHPLTAAEIVMIQRWVDQGAVEGDRRDLPSPPSWTEGWQLGQPDLIVTLRDAYTLPAAGTDVFRIFVIPLPVDVARYVRGVEFRPGNARVVHHANIRIDRTPASRQLDEQDPAPGYDGLMARTAVYPDGHFLGWTPGQIAPLLPKTLAWRLDRGTDLVVQLHMQPSGKPETVQPTVGLFFGGEPPVRTPAMLRLGSQGIDIPAGEKEYTISDSYVLPVDVEVLAVQPHAHYRARAIKGAATLPDGTEKGLIYIRDWDFRWQHVYRFVTPLALPRGTTVTMRYTYDNSAENPRNPQQPPQHVHWGQRSSDEMGDLWLQVLTRDDRDLATLVRGFQPKMLAEDVIGYETMIRANPADIELQDDVAMLYLQLGRPREATAHFEASVTLKPQSAAAHFNLATAQTSAGRLEEAIAEYRQALQIKPDYANAHNNLGGVLSSRGKVNEAIEQYREALRDDPRHAAAHNNLGHALVSEGNSVEALTHFLEALRINPEYADAHYNIGNLYALRGDWADAVEHFRRVVRLEPDWAPGLSELAWLLATAPEERLHNAGIAVRLAEHAADVTDNRDAKVLAVLAAAYADAGSFDRALATSDAALRLMPGDPLARDIRSRQALYQAQHPYRIPTGGGSRP
jgi:tetratricopeptide (TPR) repeat protein/mono/diheme cytochrome c family protein